MKRTAFICETQEENKKKKLNSLKAHAKSSFSLSERCTCGKLLFIRFEWVSTKHIQKRMVLNFPPNANGLYGACLYARGHCNPLFSFPFMLSMYACFEFERKQEPTVYVNVTSFEFSTYTHRRAHQMRFTSIHSAVCSRFYFISMLCRSYTSASWMTECTSHEP